MTAWVQLQEKEEQLQMSRTEHKATLSRLHNLEGLWVAPFLFHPPRAAVSLADPASSTHTNSNLCGGTTA